MTDFEKVKNYYRHFDEKNRLRNDNSGKLEFLMTMRILEKYLPPVQGAEGTDGNESSGGVSILDLGGGAGVYSFPLAKKGYKVRLADLSEILLAQANKQKEEDNVQNLISCDQVNATDLSCYKDQFFDVVLLFGPLYHLTEKAERKKCISEVSRVLKKGGKVFASFIPHLSGSIALVQRFCWSPDQVDINTLEECFASGKFKNLSDKGFQEGYYPASEEIENHFNANGFEKILLRSIRGFGYEKEDVIFKFKNKNVFSKILDLIDSTAEDKSIIEMCGHAMYVGVKKMSTINNQKEVKEQYANAGNLNTRISIHQKYSTNKMGFGNWIFSNYKISQGMKVLELGCGTGDMWKGHEDLIKTCGRLVLSDFSEGMLEHAKSNLGDSASLEYRVIDIQNIPFEDESFDAVIANMMLYHVPDMNRGLAEVRRVLKKGGSFYCATFGEHGIMEFLCKALNAYGVEDKANKNFTLQNGKEILEPFFSDIQRIDYEDSLAVTNLDDLIEYIYSLSSMTSLSSVPKEEIRGVLANFVINGVLNVPKEYGMFCCRKV